MFKIFVLAIFYCSIAYAGTIDPDVDESKYIEYGKKHESVLKIAGISNDPLNTSYRGSCVLISEHYFLTAAHIVHDALTHSLIHNNKAHICKYIKVHKDFKSKHGYYDIAVGRICEPIKLDFYPKLYTNNDEKNKICSISGFGFTGNFNTGYNINNYKNIRLAGSNYIDEIDRHLLICSASTGKKTSLEFLIAPGDSGGGLFINKKLAGINSCIMALDGKTDASYNDTTGHTRISIFVDWINEQIQEIERQINEKK